MSAEEQKTAVAPDEAPARAEPGEVINSRYEVLRKLGRGGMGTVFLAVDHHRSDRLVALKRVRSDRVDENILATIRNEFLSLVLLRHVNVASAYDFGVEAESGDIFLTAEYVEGPDWLKMVRTLRLDSDRDMERFLELVVGVLRGLEFIHSRGVVHLDLKPDNVLIELLPEGGSGEEAPPCPKLIDFGLAKREKDFGGKRIMGTTYYIAPETILGARVDRRTDLYSLGIVLYQLLTGRLPYRGKGNLDVFKGHLERTPAPPHSLAAHIPRQLSTIVLCLMEKKPADRFQSAIEVIGEINSEFGYSFALETDRTLASYLDGAKLVGREDELLRLHALLEQALQTESPGDESGGEKHHILPGLELSREDHQVVPLRLPAGHLVVLRGEAGLGKRRLMETLGYLVQSRGASVLQVECSEAGDHAGGDFFALVRQLLIYEAQVSRGRGTQFGIEAVSLARELNDRGDSCIDTKFRERLSVVCRRVLEASQKQPLYLHFHDLHAAGPAVIEFVFSMLEQQSEERVATRVLLTATTLDQADTEGSCLQGLYRSAVFRRSILELQLERLDLESVSRLALSALAGCDFPEQFFRRVHEESDGNSDVVLDILGFFLTRGLIRRAPLGWVLKGDFDRETIPGKARVEFRRKIDALPDAALQLVLAFSYLGDATELELAVRLAGIPAKDVEPSIALLRQAKLIQEKIEGDPAKIFSFVHSSARDTLYHLIPDADRAQEHDRAGRLCEEYYTAKGVDESKKLAYHFLRARNKEQGVVYGMAAARAYVRDFQPLEAIATYEEVMRLAGADNASVMQRLRRETADLWFQVGSYERVIDTLEPLRSAADLDGGVPARSRLCLQLARAHGRLGHFGMAAELAQEVLRWQADGSTPDVLAELLLTSAELHAVKGNPVESLRCCQRVQSRAEQVSDPRLLSWLYLLLAEGHFRLDNQAKATSYCQEALKMIDSPRDGLSPDLNLFCLGKLYKYNGKLLKAVKQFELVAQVSRRFGANDRRADALLEMGTIQLWLERPQTALPVLQQSQALYTRSENVSRSVEVFCALGETHRLLGEYDEARKCLGTAFKTAEGIDNRQAKTQALLSYAGLFLDAGDLENADRYIAKADSGDFRASGFVELKTQELRFTLAVQRGEFGEALDHAANVLVARGQGDDRIASANLLAQRALLRSRLGKPMEARRSLVMLLDVARTYHFPLCEGRARLLEGVILASEGKSELAEKSFSRAAEIFRRERSERELVQLYLERGVNFLKSGNFEESYLNFEEGFYLAKKLDLVYMKSRYYLAMGILEMMLPEGQLHRAEERLRYAERLASQVPFAEVLWQIQYYLGKLFGWQGKTKESKALHAKSLEGRRATTDRIPLTYRQGYLKTTEDKELESLLDRHLAEKKAKPVVTTREQVVE
ncbi:MAG: protein kinase [Planctomycetota bacterium]|nr:protein kinase [Planctomycetota bacterium]